MVATRWMVCLWRAKCLAEKNCLGWTCELGSAVLNSGAASYSSSLAYLQSL